MTGKDKIAHCAEKWDSFYLYDERGILESIEALKSNFPQVDFLYSLKCNPNSHVLRCIFDSGFGADAASAAEVLLAYDSGVSADNIYYSAPGKTMKDIEDCIGKAVLIADSIDEIKRIQTVAARFNKVINIGIRINPNFTFAGDGGIPSKFGVDEAQVLEFLKENHLANVKISGIHIHVKSQELSAEVLAAYYKRVFEVAEKCAELCGELEFVNMGSGMGVPYSQTDTPLNLIKLHSGLKEFINEYRKNSPNTRVIIEVGRYVVCKSGIYVTKVVDRKSSYGKTYLILKNTLNGFIRPSLARLIERYAPDGSLAGAEPLFTSKQAFDFLSLKDEAALETVTLVGNLCTASDVIAEDIQLPPLACGDVIVITNAGSYAAVLSPFQFSLQEKPVELFLTRDGEAISSSGERTVV